MKFIIDNQLPAALARFLVSTGHDAVHVLNAGLESADDVDVWSRGALESRIVVSKDEDFLHLAQRGKPPGRLLWIRLKNCRNPVLLEAVGKALPRIVREFEAGATVVELR